MLATAELRIAPPIAAMEAFFESHARWVETVIGCEMRDALRFQVEIPAGEVALTDLLDGLPLDRECLAGGDALRPIVTRWAVPPNIAPLIYVSPSRARSAPLMEKSHAWDAHWSDCPIGIWLPGIEHGVVTVQIPHVVYGKGLFARSTGWVVVNRSDAVSVLKALRHALERRRKYLRVFGGRPVNLPHTEYSWRDVVMDPEVNQILRVDFETFLPTRALVPSSPAAVSSGLLALTVRRGTARRASSG